MITSNYLLAGNSQNQLYLVPFVSQKHSA